MLIDVHSHCSPLQFPPSPAAEVAKHWPCMSCVAGVHTVSFGDKPFRVLDSRSWDSARRIDNMDEDGVDVQVLSPMPELLSYWIDAEAAERLSDHVNGFIADIVARNPRRFLGLGMLPLQDVDRAVPYLQRCRDVFGLVGVEIGSNINGLLLGDPALYPFYEAAEALGMSVFVHALHPLVRQVVGADPIFNGMAGFPIDVGIAGASLLLAGLPEKLPNLRLALSHGGGALPSMLGRLEMRWHSDPSTREALKRSPTDLAASLFYDSNVHDQPYLRHLALHVAPGHVFLGTDYPYAMRQEAPARYVCDSGLDEQALAAVRGGAAAQFLGRAGFGR